MGSKPSRKLEVLIKTLQHHLTKSNAVPLSMDEDGIGMKEVPVPTPSHSEIARPRHDGSPDKVIVYSFFVKNNGMILNVCGNSIIHH